MIKKSRKGFNMKTLSENRISEIFTHKVILKEKDVKEFIKIILEEEFEEWIKGCVCKDGVWTIYNADFTAFKERIKKRAGKDLI